MNHSKTVLSLLLLLVLARCGNVVVGNGNRVKGDGNYIDHGDGNSVNGDDNTLRESFRNQILGNLNDFFKTNGLSLQGNGYSYQNGVAAGRQNGNLQTEDRTEPC